MPIFPNPFILSLGKIEQSKKIVIDPSTLNQLRVIKNVISQCSSIIVATDAGSEGELMFWYIYEYLKSDKPVERLWISSLTDKAILEGLGNLMPVTDFDDLYAGAKERIEADWLVGINATQALTQVIHQEAYSLGRIQTPTLALICKRYIEHQDFKKQKYWQIRLQHRKDYLDFTSLSAEQWEERTQPDQIVKSIAREGKGYVEDITVKTVQEQPPLLFDLTELQKMGNRKLGLSADEVLQTAQSLYEKKFITYPRTGSQYIPEDLWIEIPELVRILKTAELFRSLVLNLKFGNFNKNIVNTLKTTDHHGLLITTKVPSALSAIEKSIYDMIAYRLLESLSEPCLKKVSDITIKVCHYEFHIKGSVILSKGWRCIQGILSDVGGDIRNNKNIHTIDEPLIQLSDCKIGDELKISETILLEKITSPPCLYTEADLLSVMEQAGRQTESKNEQKTLANIGIGTPATRASIIETLLSRNYIIRKSKTLQPTSKGLQVYNLVKDKKIANVQRTAEWEMLLDQVEKGICDGKQFSNDIRNYTSEIVQELLSLSIPKEIIPELQCPQCRQNHLIIKDHIVRCSDERCSWIMFRKMCGIKLSIEEITSLLSAGKTPLIHNMKSKNGHQFSAFIILKDDFSTSFEFIK